LSLQCHGASGLVRRRRDVMPSRMRQQSTYREISRPADLYALPIDLSGDPPLDITPHSYPFRKKGDLYGHSRLIELDRPPRILGGSSDSFLFGPYPFVPS
jgi:hypothetical protein